jgi:uncharacterized protein
MKIAFIIHTPGQANFWHYPILKLKEKGNPLLILARDDQSTCALLKSYNIQFITYGKITGKRVNKTLTEKIAELPIHLLKSLYELLKFKPDIIIGTGIIEAYSAYLLRKPCIIFEDTEITPALERIQWLHLASTILTPDCCWLQRNGVSSP